jgi:hypothetical protein
MVNVPEGTTHSSSPSSLKEKKEIEKKQNQNEDLEGTHQIEMSLRRSLITYCAVSPAWMS